MKKALVLLGAAAVALALFAGCQQEVLDANIKDVPSGSGNHDFEGETYVYSLPIKVILKTTTTISATAPVETQEVIPVRVKTYTLTLNDDNTFTYSDVATFAAGADGVYTDSATATQTVTYEYYDWNGSTWVLDQSADGHSWSGFAGKLSYSDTTTGTWDSFKVVTDGYDTYTLKFTFNPTSTTTVGNNDNHNWAGTSAYVLSSTDTSIYPESYTNPVELSYTYKGKDDNKNNMYYLSASFMTSGLYTQQE